MLFLGGNTDLIWWVHTDFGGAKGTSCACKNTQCSNAASRDEVGGWGSARRSRMGFGAGIIVGEGVSRGEGGDGDGE